MVKSQTLMTFLPLILLSSIATATATNRPATLGRRGLTTYCDPIFGVCHQWPFPPIISGNHYVSRPFLRRPNPPLYYTSPPYVVVPSPPPVWYRNPPFTAPYEGTNPSFSPLVASPPPPGYTMPRVDGNLPPVNILPPIAGKGQPDNVFMSPPVQNWAGGFNVPPPPLVPINAGGLQRQETIMPPPVGEKAGTKPQLPPIALSPPPA